MQHRTVLKKAKLIARYYRNYFFPCLATNLFCLKLLYDEGLRTIGGIILLKITVYGLILLYCFGYGRRGLFYYRNLGLDALQLFGFGFAFDMLLFLIPALIFIYVS